MSAVNDCITRLHDLFSEIKDIIAPITMPTITLAVSVPINKKASDGRILRDFVSEARKAVAGIMERPDIRSEAYGMSGTKNELLRDRFGDMTTAIVNLENAVHDYLEGLIDSFASTKVTQHEVNQLLSGDSRIATDGTLDDVALFKLRVFTHNNPTAEYSRFIAEEMSRLGGHAGDKCLVPVNKYGLVQKGILHGLQGVTGYDAVKSLITADDKRNSIIVFQTIGREYFKNVTPKPGDANRPISGDFVERMTSIVSVPEKKDGACIVHLPRVGALVSVYVTFDYITFFFMTPAFDENLTPYYRAVGYYSAMTGVRHADTPTLSHATYNDRAVAIFAERFYRHDLILLGTSFKPGAGLSDALKSHIREGFLKRVVNTPIAEINPREVIYNAIVKVLPNGSKESRISSYLGSMKLVDVFTKEYDRVVATHDWSTHPEVTMIGVINDVYKKCDKMNVWTIDFKSPKDLF
jgi:hypothetical protein